MLFLLKKVLKFWSKFSRLETITGHGEDTPYLMRYHLINNRWFKLYLHFFLRNDEDTPHDHPWASLSFGISKKYIEEIYDWRTRSHKVFKRSPGKFVWRPKSLVHRIKVNECLSHLPPDWKNRAPTTLFFAFTKSQEWGFVRDYDTAPKWTHWKEYLGVK